MKERIVRAFLRCMESIPLPVLALFCEVVMLLVCTLDRKHRRIARTNLRIAFPGMEEFRANQVVRACYRNLGTSAAEFLHIPKMSDAYLRNHFHVEGGEHLRESMEIHNRPVMVMTGHFGNWELLSHVYGKMVTPVAFVVRPLKDAVLDRIVTERRSCAGNTVIRKEDSAREVIRALRRKIPVGILMDQNVDRHRGIPVDFFGRKAYTTFGIARLALATNAAIHPGFIFRDPKRKFHHTLRFGPPIPFDSSLPRESAVAQVLRMCNAELENAIRIAPDHWMWFQRRYKTRPQGEPGIYGEDP